MLAYALHTDYLNTPLGIDVLNPRFTWKCRVEADESFQSAYRLEVSNNDGSVLWDTGKKGSNLSTHIMYDGKSLASRMRVIWRVKLWDEYDLEGEWSEYTWFEIGLVNPSDWSATWISAPCIPSKKKRYSADYFQKMLSLEKKVVKARLYATACGLYTFAINGRRAGGDVLAPGFTDYRKRLQYQTYDVTSLLAVGENELIAVVGDGWFRGKIGAYGKRCAFGKRTAFLAQLELWFEDGTQKTIATDASFLWSNDGPIRENDLKNGECYDAIRKPLYAQHAAQTRFSTRLVCSNNVPVREHEHLSAKLLKTPNGQTVLDFSQNLAGYVRFLAPADVGHTVILRFGETLDADGNFTQANLQIEKEPKEPVEQKISYRCSDKRVLYQPSFSAFGFRYVLVENWPGAVDPTDFTAIAVYSDMEQTGEFSCGNPLVNRLVENTRWSMKSNFLDVPTDCPQRERNPWTGDAQVFYETGAWLMNTAPMMRKWLRDVTDAQKRNGCVRSLAPHQAESWFVKGMDGSVGWADAIVLIPYRMYQLYQDEQILKDSYPAMRRYAEFMIRRCRKISLLNKPRKNPYRQFTYAVGQHWGEWAEPKQDQFERFWALGLPRPEEATAYFAYSMRCMAEIAQILRFSEDAARYKNYADGAKQAYRYLFVKDGDIESSRPAKLVRPLALGLLEEQEVRTVSARLAALQKQRGYTVGTGFLSTPFLLGALSENGYLDTAYETLLQEELPGWLYPVKHGASTIWEQWEGIDKNGLGSLNHYSKGAVCQWLVQNVAGIRMGTVETFTILPRCSRRLMDAHAAYDSLFGRVESSWRIVVDEVHYRVSIPANTTARVCLPDGSEQVVQPGEHAFRVPLATLEQ